jgi:hypothetical protein
VSPFASVIEHTIEIAAPPARVFEVLTRAEAWSSWSTLLLFRGGTLERGGRVRLGLRTAAASYDFWATITVWDPDSCFEWLAHTGIKGLFDGRHRFELTALSEGRTRLRNVEFYTGLLNPVISRLPMMKTAPDGFREMNEQLRARAEAGCL